MNPSLDFNAPEKELKICRKLLAIAGTIYFLWWFAVEALLPLSFNPPLGRFLVVATLFGFLGASYWSRFFRDKIHFFLNVGLWLMTLHYYYLFYGNLGDPNWVMGSFITVIAVNFCFFSAKALWLYTIFVAVLSAILTFLIPALKESIFLPGVLTIMVQANVGMRIRLRDIRKLAASDERFQLLFDTEFEGVFVHENRKIINTNESLLKILGYSREEFLKLDALQIVHPKNRDFVEANMTKTVAPPYEVEGVRKDGEVFDMEVHGKSLEYNGRPARLVAIRDIGFKKKAEKEKIMAKSMEESIRLRDEFFAIASHELKTPLTPLKIQTQLMKRRIKDGELNTNPVEKFSNYVNIVTKQSGRLEGLVEAMLDVSRISAGKLILNKETMDLSPIVREIVELRQPENATMVPRITMSGPQHLILFADRYRIEQVIENLLTNAIKYGGGKPIKIDLREEGPTVILDIKDQGVGIPQDNLARIFNRFERASATRQTSGLGLGLYIAKQIIEDHGGKITVKSQVGEGSTFTVVLPIHRDQINS